LKFKKSFFTLIFCGHVIPGKKQLICDKTNKLMQITRSSCFPVRETIETIEGKYEN
jgi:hypothetical protein